MLPGRSFTTGAPLSPPAGVALSRLDACGVDPQPPPEQDDSLLNRYYTFTLTPRRLLQLQKRPVRRLRVKEDDGHAVRAERRRREYSKAPTLEVSRGRGDIRNLVADVVQAAGRVPLQKCRDR